MNGFTEMLFKHYYRIISVISMILVYIDINIHKYYY